MHAQTCRKESKQAHTWYQRARLRGECVWLLYQEGSVCAGRNSECVCWGMRGLRWWTADPAAGGPAGRLSRDTEGQSRSSAVHSSRGQRSLSGRLKALKKVV